MGGEHAHFADVPARTQAYRWQRFYEAVILETNRSCLPRLIQTAQAAIDARLEQLRSGVGSTHERQALADARDGLDMLRKEIR